MNCMWVNVCFWCWLSRNCSHHSWVIESGSDAKVLIFQWTDIMYYFSAQLFCFLFHLSLTVSFQPCWFQMFRVSAEKKCWYTFFCWFCRFARPFSTSTESEAAVIGDCCNRTYSSSHFSWSWSIGGTACSCSLHSRGSTLLWGAYIF